jgi:hypothetical protein
MAKGEKNVVIVGLVVGGAIDVLIRAVNSVAILDYNNGATP